MHTRTMLIMPLKEVERHNTQTTSWPKLGPSCQQRPGVTHLGPGRGGWADGLPHWVGGNPSPHWEGPQCVCVCGCARVCVVGGIPTGGEESG